MGRLTDAGNQDKRIPMNIEHAKVMVAHLQRQEVAMTTENPPSLPEPIRPGAIGAAVTLLQVISNAALNDGYDLESMERLFAMHLAMESRAEERLFDEAMARAQSAMKGVAADSDNPQTKSSYASYYALDKAIRPIYTSNGFSLQFGTAALAFAGLKIVNCRVSHAEGFTRTFEIPMPADGEGASGNDIMTETHAIDSAITYGMHCLLQMIFNLAVGGNGR